MITGATGSAKDKDRREMIGDFFVLDAVTHAYNQVKENYAEPIFADAMVEMAYHLGADATVRAEFEAT